jgi:hypothetical protein
VGFAWYLGPFELTWVWAKRLKNSVAVLQDTDGNPLTFEDFIRIPDPYYDSSIQSSFYIGTAF